MKNIEFDDFSITDWQSNRFAEGQLGIIRVGVDNRTKTELAGKTRLLPGVYALVEVMGKPRKRGVENDPNWIKPPENAMEKLVVDIRYIENLLSNPLILDILKLNPEITDKYLLSGFQASSMPLDPKTYYEILRMIS